MTLFAALTATSSSSSPPSSSSTTASSSSCSPPEAIQLYSNLSIDFLSGSTRSLESRRRDAAALSDATASNANGDATASSRYFSLLSYQAVQVDSIKANGRRDNADDDDNRTTSPGDHARPDLGVWDCRVPASPADDGGPSAASTVLRRVVVDRRRPRRGGTSTSTSTTASNSNSVEEKKDGESAGDDREPDAPPPSTVVDTVILPVDLSDPARVQPTLEQMRRAVVAIYRDLPANDAETEKAARTTSVAALAAAAFGSARVVHPPDRPADERGPRIALLLAAVLPSSAAAAASSSSLREDAPASEYRRRQTRALILYHLHKFAWEVDAALCFVSEGDGDDSAFLLGRNSAMSIGRFADLVRRVAVGLPPSEDDGVAGTTSAGADEKGAAGGNDNPDGGRATNGDDDDDDVAASLPTVHLPGTHDAELILGAYLRNASCDGQWDAAKNDLIEALPPPPPTSHRRGATDDAASAADKSAGDEEFLAKLASSIGIDPDSLSSSSYDTGVVGSPSKSASAAGGGVGGAATDGDATALNAKALTPADKKALLKKKSARAGGAVGAKKDQKEVSSFFDSLLKK